MELTQTPVLIWGGGAIGGCLAAYWARAGVPVLMIDIVETHVRACREVGLAISGPIEEFSTIVPAMTPAELVADSRVRPRRFQRIVLAVKAQHTEAALDALEPFVADDGYVMSAQNGLNEIAIARRLGAERAMGCFVNFGADWHGPGRVLYGNRGAVVVGEVRGEVGGDRAGAPRPRTLDMHRLLQRFDADAILTDNIDGYLWGKLAYGAMLFATALTPDSMAANFSDASRLPVFDAVGCEVMAVAAARGARPIGFGGHASTAGEFDPLAFMPTGDPARRTRVLDWLADYTAHSAKTHSGIWRDLAVRKRKTEVDAQIGIIVALGKEAGIETPTLARLVTLIHDVEDGRRPMSVDTLRLLVG